MYYSINKNRQQLVVIALTMALLCCKTCCLHLTANEEGSFITTSAYTTLGALNSTITNTNDTISVFGFGVKMTSADTTQCSSHELACTRIANMFIADVSLNLNMNRMFRSTVHTGDSIGYGRRDLDGTPRLMNAIPNYRANTELLKYEQMLGVYAGVGYGVGSQYVSISGVGGINITAIAPKSRDAVKVFFREMCDPSSQASAQTASVCGSKEKYGVHTIPGIFAKLDMTFQKVFGSGYVLGVGINIHTTKLFPSNAALINVYEVERFSDYVRMLNSNITTDEAMKEVRLYKRHRNMGEIGCGISFAFGTLSS